MAGLGVLPHSCWLPMESGRATGAHWNLGVPQVGSVW